MELSDLFDTYDHILEKILSYVEDANSAVLTCKTFYKAVCRNEKFKKILYISQTRIRHHFDSIINTGRQFNEIILASDEDHANCLSNGDLIVLLEQIRKVSNQFGEDVTKASIHFTSWKTSQQFVNFLNTMPHLMELSMHDVHIDTIQWDEQTTLNLHNLSTLDFSDSYGIEGEGFLNLLPNDVLQNVKFSFTFSDYSNLFERQRNLKKLKVLDLFEIDKFHNVVELQELSIDGGESNSSSLYYDSGLLEILELQPKLLKLEISDAIDKPIAVNICTKLKQLQSLSICFGDAIPGDEVLPALVSNLSKLSNLEELTLLSLSFDISTLTLVPQPMVKKLFLHILEPEFFRMDIDAAGLLLLKKAFPSLIEIGLKGVVPFNIPELLNIFTDIETLSLRIFTYLARKKDLFEISNETTHANIKTFFLSFHRSHSSYSCDPIDKEFKKFCSTMLNLESMEIWNPTYFLTDVNGLNDVLKYKLTKLNKLNVFKTDSYGIIH